MSEELRLSEAKKKIKVVLEDPVSESERTLFLLELDGLARDKYLNSLKRAMTADEERIKSFIGLQSNLLKRCLYEETGEGELELLSEEEIQSFPSGTQSALFDAARKLSGLDKEAEDTAGND